jgi:hypothetical protein
MKKILIKYYFKKRENINITDNTGYHLSNSILLMENLTDISLMIE